MTFFQKVEGDGAVVVERGVYRQVELFSRAGYLYVKLGSGFVRLMADGSTSKLGGSLRLVYLSYDGPLGRDELGRLTQADALEASTVLQAHERQRLITG